MTAANSAPGADRRGRTRPEIVMSLLEWIQELVYLGVIVILVLSGIAVVYGTAKEVVEGLSNDKSAVELGLLMLDRVLLLLIVAELLHTLRIVLYEGEIHAEPFLLVGLIAVVRRVVVVTAQVEQERAPPSSLLLELGVLAGLALAFGAAIFLLRHGAAHENNAEPQAV